MITLKDLMPKPDIHAETVWIRSDGHKMPLLILRPVHQKQEGPGVLWIHGGGYFLGMKEMVYISRAENLVRKYGAVVISPGYRMAPFDHYPAAVRDCYHALLYMKRHAKDLGIRSDQLMVGGESAGGGLAASVCLIARDMKTVNIAFQMPLYPMISYKDTESSRDNHGRVWNTKRNHLGWRLYLGRKKGNVSRYASPSEEKDYHNLPELYTFVGTGEPFYDETCAYVENLRKAGIKADIDIYPEDMHAFDMLRPDSPVSKEAIRRFEAHFEEAVTRCFKEQEED